jgi:hypothetical protein
MDRGAFLMRDMFGHPIREGSFIAQTVDGISGVTHEFGEDLYLEPEQRDLGWPALHLYSFRNANDWDPAKAKEWFSEWLRWSLPPGCSCAVHIQATLEAFPLFDEMLTDPDSFFYWGVELHNAINARIDVDHSHPQVPLARAREIWSRIAAAGQVAWFRPVDDNIKGGRRLVITVATGKAREWLRYTEGPMRAYAEACGADFVALKNTTQGWWGLEKFRVHAFAKQYEETLYLDADVLVTESADESIFQTQASVSIHDEFNYLPATSWVEASVKSVSSCIDYRPVSRLFIQSLNSGVVHCKQHGADVWKPPTLPIPTGHVSEQTLVGINFHRMQVAKRILSPRKNCQVWNRSFNRILPDAHFVHASGELKKTELLRSLVEQLRLVGNPALTLTLKD